MSVILGINAFHADTYYFPAGPGVENKMLINTVVLRHKDSNSFSLNNSE